MTQPRPTSTMLAAREMKREVLATLRRVCANLRAMEREVAAIRAFREVEALLAREEQRVSRTLRGKSGHRRAPLKVARRPVSRKRDVSRGT